MLEFITVGIGTIIGSLLVFAYYLGEMKARLKRIEDKLIFIEKQNGWLNNLHTISMKHDD